MSKNVATAKQRTLSASGRGKKMVDLIVDDEVANPVDTVVVAKQAAKTRGKNALQKIEESVQSNGVIEASNNLEAQSGNNKVKRKGSKISVTTDDNAKLNEQKSEDSGKVAIAVEVIATKTNQKSVRKRGAIVVVEKDENNVLEEIPSVKRRQPRAKKGEETNVAKEQPLTENMPEPKTEVKKTEKVARGKKKIINEGSTTNELEKLPEKKQGNKDENVNILAKTGKPNRGKKEETNVISDSPMQVEEQSLKAEEKVSRGKKKSASVSFKEIAPENDAEDTVEQNGIFTRSRKRVPIQENVTVIAEEPISKKKTNKKEELEKPVKVSRGKKTAALKENINIEEEETSPEIKVPAKTSRKRAANTIKAADEVDGAKVAKVLKNETHTAYDKDSFAMEKPHTFKISSWNVAGLRSWMKKDGFKFLEIEEPDIFCLQETKCALDQLPDDATNCSGYHRYWLCMPGGYAGVAIYTRIMPINVEYGIGDTDFDENGRLITAEFEKFILVNVYVPNSGRKLVNLAERMRWEKLFLEHVQRLDKLKPVIICGDMNVSHAEIDLANPKANVRNAGFTVEEREHMTNLLAAGFVDSFRHLYPKRTGAYTFWTYMGGARARNVGWRLDYFLLSERFMPRVVDHVIRSQCMGSDHCPITLFLQI